MSVSVRRIVASAAVLIALVLSLMPVITGERAIDVHSHHIDHAVLMLFGAVIGLALYHRRDDREASRWIWAALLPALVAMLLMSPALYALVEQSPPLHALDHIVFVALAALTAYAGQRYVYGIGWVSALFLETMAFVAAFGYGVAPTLAIPLPPPPAAVQSVSSRGNGARGKLLFAQNCAACHGATGQGGAGPVLKNETTRKNLAHVESWIKKPAPPMPALYPNPLSGRDVADVAAFVESLK